MRKLCVVIFLSIFIIISNTANAGLKVKGTPIKLIGGNGTIYMHPLWSPDGTKIAFTAARYQGIWVMNADGSGIRNISDEPAAGFGFEWSFDSKAILSRVAKFDERYRYNAVKVFDIEKKESKLLTDYRTFMPGLPHWADGDQKVYMFNRGKLEIFESGRTANLLKKSAVSKQIYFLKNDQIGVGNIDTKNYKIIEPIKGEQCLNMVVSPDQSKVAFEILGGNLYVMNIDGSGLVDLGDGHRPQWSPDSQRLVYMITADDGYRYLLSDIYTIKIDGMEQVRLTVTDNKLEMNPSWSPDGKKIAYDVFDEGAIYILELSGE
jgi:Tol biopolymer transport system component